MSQPLRICQHIYDTGGTCNSAAATGHNYCAAHVRYRARQLHMAQHRARGERYNIKIPPLDSMQAVHSVLSQLAEALAADMIDLKRADRLTRVLNIASRNLLKADKWPAAPIFHSDEPAAEIDIAKEYGLPRDLDLDIPPEQAFPAPQEVGAPPFSPDFGERVGNIGGSPLSVDNCGVSDHGQPANGSLKFGPEHPISPEFLELRDIRNTQGDEAEALRYKQLERNRTRRELRINRKRYTDLARLLNIKWAAEQIAEKTVAAKLKEAGVAPVEESQDFDTRVAKLVERMRAGDAEIDAYLAGKEVQVA